MGLAGHVKDDLYEHGLRPYLLRFLSWLHGYRAAVAGWLILVGGLSYWHFGIDASSRWWVWTIGLVGALAIVIVGITLQRRFRPLVLVAPLQPIGGATTQDTDICHKAIFDAIEASAGHRPRILVDSLDEIVDIRSVPSRRRGLSLAADRRCVVLVAGTVAHDKSGVELDLRVMTPARLERGNTRKLHAGRLSSLPGTLPDAVHQFRTVKAQEVATLAVETLALALFYSGRRSECREIIDAASTPTAAGLLCAAYAAFLDEDAADAAHLAARSVSLRKTTAAIAIASLAQFDLGDRDGALATWRQRADPDVVSDDDAGWDEPIFRALTAMAGVHALAEGLTAPDAGSEQWKAARDALDDENDPQKAMTLLRELPAYYQQASTSWAALVLARVSTGENVVSCAELATQVILLREEQWRRLGGRYPGNSADWGRIAAAFYLAGEPERARNCLVPRLAGTDLSRAIRTAGRAVRMAGMDVPEPLREIASESDNLGQLTVAVDLAERRLRDLEGVGG
jgi:hypothetical protein